jgi:hypothetical protein
MSAYQAKISLIVEGEQKIKSLQDRVNNLSKQITELTRLDVRKVFDDTLISGAISHLKKAREEEAKATNGVIKGQRLLNNSTEQRLVQQIKLNAAVDLYARRVNELGRTSAGDQKQFQARIEDIQKGFEFFKGKGSVQGVQAVATELGRIVEYSREVNRLETGRIRSQEQLRGYSAEIAKYKALGLNTNKAETTFDKLAVNAGTNKYALAEKYNIVLGKRLRILKDEATAQKQEANRVEKLQFRPSSPIQGAVDIIGSPINKQMGTQAAVALAQQKQKAADLELKELQKGTKSAVALAQQKQKAADLELKELQKGTKSAVALAQQKQKAADLELKELQKGTKSAVALAQQKQKAADQQKKAGAQRAESIALGVGFPLMFGAGPASVAGSLAGSFAGSGFGGQILGGALGAAIDKLGVAAITTAQSLSYPIEGFEKLKEAGLFASRGQEYYISKLIETGRVAEATAVIQAEIIKKIGVRGVNDLTALDDSTVKLSKAWADFNIQLQAALAGPLAGLLGWLTGLVQTATMSTQATNVAIDLRRQGSKEAADALSTKVGSIQQKSMLRSKGLFIEGSLEQDTQDIKKLTEYYKQFVKIKPVAAKLSPEDQEKAIKAAEQQADTIKDAYRTGFRLQQQGIDLQRQGSDLQRRVAQDVYNKQQEILRLQVDNDRQRKQVAIETVDLEYRRRISNEEGRVAAVLEAEAALMKTKAEGEANIEAKKRLLELDIDKQKRETENYIFELGRTIDGIRRSTLSLEMDVVDYRLKIERQIGEQRRIEENGQAAGAPTGGGMGKVIEYFTGDPKLGAAGGYRADHGGSNYHDHIAYKTAKEAKEAAALLNRSGIKTTELKGVNPVGGHAARSYHYSGQAFDVPGAQVPVGQEPALSAKVRKILQIGGGTAKPLPSWLGPIAKGANKPAGSMETQLQNAAGQAITRPVVTPNVAGVQAGMGEYNEKNAALRKEALSIEQQLSNIAVKAAQQRVLDAARGPIELKQRREAVLYAEADLRVADKTNSAVGERLALEAQSAVKLAIRKQDDNTILSNYDKAVKKLKDEGKNVSALVEFRKELVQAQKDGILNTEEQIELDLRVLNIAERNRVIKEQAAIQAQLGITGKGLQAGFIGQAGQAYESELQKSGGNVEQAQAMATQTQALELATTKARALEGAYKDIGSAMASTLTDGVAGLVAGTTTAEQVFSDFLKNIGQALMKAAQQMIAQYLAIAAAKALAGLFGGGAATPTGTLPQTDMFKYVNLDGLRAAGGPVSSNSSYMVGEKGPELFMPSTAGTIIPADATAAAMARYQRQGGGSGGGNSSSDAMGDGAAATPVLSMSFETTRFLGQDYVSTDQLQAAMMATEKRAAAAGAKAGAAQITSKLQQSPNYRRQVGLR